MHGTGDIRFFDLLHDPLSVNEGFYMGSPHGSKSSLGSGGLPQTGRLADLERLWALFLTIPPDNTNHPAYDSNLGG
jgi:hypothetical protein